MGAKYLGSLSIIKAPTEGGEYCNRRKPTSISSQMNIFNYHFHVHCSSPCFDSDPDSGTGTDSYAPMVLVMILVFLFLIMEWE